MSATHEGPCYFFVSQSHAHQEKYRLKKCLIKQSSQRACFLCKMSSRTKEGSFHVHSELLLSVPTDQLYSYVVPLERNRQFFSSASLFNALPLPNTGKSRKVLNVFLSISKDHLNIGCSAVHVNKGCF